jgi:hypothetical protein
VDYRRTLIVAVAACGRAEPPGVAPAADATVEMCAAYPFNPNETHAVVIDRSGSPGEVVTWHDRNFNVHHSDCLKVAAADIRSIAWAPDGPQFAIAVRAVGAVADRIEERTEKRMSQFEALYMDGELYTVALHEHVVDSLWLVDRDRARQAAFYERLTGANPPR